MVQLIGSIIILYFGWKVFTIGIGILAGMFSVLWWIVSPLYKIIWWVISSILKIIKYIRIAFMYLKEKFFSKLDIFFNTDLEVLADIELISEMLQIIC
ncbi:MAG: hypothetical protein ATN35_09725 [Epulopiscium sp. Nele67-Bin004]|nr:MAG: hypothetical protein ATN35_09725 [Epulopiscium sp. Nele67-Bin004]